jgi:hypothetical protein
MYTIRMKYEKIEIRRDCLLSCSHLFGDSRHFSAYFLHIGDDVRLFPDFRFRLRLITITVPDVSFAYIQSFAHDHIDMSSFALLFENNRPALVGLTSKRNS